jgi:hypothetical protein
MACRGVENGDTDKLFTTVAYQNALIGHFGVSRLLRALKTDIQHVRLVLSPRLDVPIPHQP